MGIITSTGSRTQSCAGSRSPKYSQRGHFVMLFCRRAAKKLQSYIVHSALFGDVLAAVAVEVCVRSVLKIGQRPGRFPVCPISAGIPRMSLGKHANGRE